VSETKPMPSSALRRRDRVLVLAMFLLLVAACAANLGRRPASVPVQGWWKARGPVVPHDSFPADCGLCHEGDGWADIRDDFRFDHLAQTGVELVGAHSEAECLRCHNDRGPVASFAQRGCAGCHEDVHRGQLGSRCESCHADTDPKWRVNEIIARHNETRFPLVGAHAAAECWRCHSGAEVGNFTRVSVECADCHQDDLARATDPDHLALGYVDDCERCHVPTTWSGAGFIHSAWPLTGAHRSVDCSECHVNGVYSGTPTDCYACHADDYNATTDPNHVMLGISTSCEECHNTTSWDGADFDHSTWPLTGAHLTTNCSECHVNGMYQGTPTDCYACHADDYNATTDPNHTAAGFPTSCEVCHTTVTWNGADFDHDFPIDSGAHANIDCAECHTTPMNYVLFSCIDCHEHNKSDTDEHHKEVSGYSYDSLSCYECHPKGRH